MSGVAQSAKDMGHSPRLVEEALQILGHEPRDLEDLVKVIALLDVEPPTELCANRPLAGEGVADAAAAVPAGQAAHGSLTLHGRRLAACIASSSEACNVVAKLFVNILQNPDQEEFRAFKTDSQTFRVAVGYVPEVLEFLRLAGFMLPDSDQAGEASMAVVFEESDDSLQLAYDLLCDAAIAEISKRSLVDERSRKRKPRAATLLQNEEARLVAEACKHQERAALPCDSGRLPSDFYVDLEARSKRNQLTAKSWGFHDFASGEYDKVKYGMEHPDEFQEIDRRAAGMNRACANTGPKGRATESEISSFVQELVRPYKHCDSPNDVNQIRAIFAWITTHVTYQEFKAERELQGDSRSSQDPLDVFARCVCVCEGFARLFEKMAAYAGLEAEYVVGRTKIAKKNVRNAGEDVTHAWNMVNLGARWYFVDCTWSAAAGYEHISKCYFLVAPEEAIFQFLPSEAKHQHVNPNMGSHAFKRFFQKVPVDNDAFLQAPNLYPNFFRLSLRLLAEEPYYFLYRNCLNHMTVHFHLGGTSNIELVAAIHRGSLHDLRNIWVPDVADKLKESKVMVHVSIRDGMVSLPVEIPDSENWTLLDVHGRRTAGNESYAQVFSALFTAVAPK